MGYVLREQLNNQYYCKNHNKIIVFPNEQIAADFVNAFAQYAMAQAMQFMMEDPRLIIEVQQTLQSTKIEGQPKENNLEFITYEEILREKGVY